MKVHKFWKKMIVSSVICRVMGHPELADLVVRGGRGGLLRLILIFLSPAFWLGAKEKLLFHMILIQSICFELTTYMKQQLIQRTMFFQIFKEIYWLTRYLCICCREEFMSSFLIISNIKLLLFSSNMIKGLSCHFSLFSSA